MKYSLKEFQIFQAKKFKKSLISLKGKISTIDELKIKLYEVQKNYKLLNNSFNIQKDTVNTNIITKKCINENDNIIEFEIGRFILLVSKKTNKILKSNLYGNLLVNHTISSVQLLLSFLQIKKSCDLCGEFYKNNFEEPTEIHKQIDFIIIVHKSCIL